MTPNKKNNTPFYIFFGCICYLFCCLLSLHAGTILVNNPQLDTVNAVFQGMDHLLQNPFNIGTFNKYSLKCLGITSLLFACVVLIFIVDHQRNKHDMSGEESGSAKWNSDLKKYNKEFSDPHGADNNRGDYNMILTQDVYLDMNTRNTQRNNNVCVVGGSGSGKSRFFVKPNILQANCNYVITDPAGDLLKSTGKTLQQLGYKIKVFNLVEMSKSNCYNPFHYIRDDQGVLMMINCLIKNTNPAGQGASDPFWEKSETALLQALCFYLIKYRPVEERNFTSVMRLLRAAEINENNPNAKSKLDRIFDEVQAKDPNSIALKQYQTFKMGAGKTLKSILISCSVRLTVFNLKQIENLTRTDDIHLEELGGKTADDKQALFVIIPAADNTFNFLVSMMYSQLFETLYFVAETQCEKQRLYRHVRFLLDEFANIGQIPEFTQKLSTMRKYEISCNIILQNLAQIKTMYKDDWETIIGNSDSFLFLGGQEYSTLEYISKELGDQTITVRDHSHSQGKSSSSSKSFKQTSRKLMFPDELGKMDNRHCILMIRGLDPFYSKKYDYTKHPRYKLTGDANSQYEYVSTLNNMATTTKTEMLNEYESRRAKIFKNANESTNPNTRILGDFMNAEEFAKSFNLTDCSDLFKRFVLVSSGRVSTGDVLNKTESETKPEQNKSTQQQQKTANDSTTPPPSTPRVIAPPITEKASLPTVAPPQKKKEITASQTSSHLPQEPANYSIKKSQSSNGENTADTSIPNVQVNTDDNGDSVEDWFFN